MELIDEYGERWVVERGDPASSAINYLIRAGLPSSYIIMPRSVLMFGMTGLPHAGKMEADNDATIDAHCRYWDTCETLRGGNFEKRQGQGQQA